jgi:hypothetical protein
MSRFNSTSPYIPVNVVRDESDLSDLEEHLPVVINSARLKGGESGPEALKQKCNLRSLDEDGLCIDELTDAQCCKFAAVRKGCPYHDPSNVAEASARGKNFLCASGGWWFAAVYGC